ncbi:hypothetical protein BPNSA17_19210 [Bordetella petrii]
MVFGEDALEQGGLARTEKAGEDGDGNHFVQTALGIHGKAKAEGAEAQGRGSGADYGRPLLRPDAGLQHSKGGGANPGPTLANALAERPETVPQSNR